VHKVGICLEVIQNRSICQRREHVAGLVKQQGNLLLTRFVHISAGVSAVNKNYYLHLFSEIWRHGDNIDSL